MVQEQEYEYTVDEYWKLVETFPDHKYEFVDGSIWSSRVQNESHINDRYNHVMALTTFIPS